MTPQEESPLELEKHKGDTEVSVWKRRLMFVLMIVLCIGFAAPTFGSCGGAFDGRGGAAIATYRVRGQQRALTQKHLEEVQTSLNFAAQVVGGTDAFAWRFRREEPRTEEHFWTHVMLADMARAEGIHVTDQQITDALVAAGFETAGKFDRAKYDQFLRGDGRSAVTHDQFTERVREILAVRRMAESWQITAAMVPSKEVFEEWKKSHRKVSADWVVQPFAPFRAKAESDPVTDAELTAIAELPEVRAMRAVPARRGYEAASILLRDATDEQLRAMAAFVAESGMIRAGASLEQLAWQVFSAAKAPGDAYSREAWIASKVPAYAAAKKAWDEKKAAWDKEHAADPKPFADPEPTDPAKEPWPEKASEQFDKHWIARATAEVLVRETLRHLVLRAERESKPLAALAADYAKFGVVFHATTEPIADDRITDDFPGGLGKLSDLQRLVRSQFVLRTSKDGVPEAFSPRVHPEPVCTTAFGTHYDERGFFVVRWTSMEDARLRPVAELKDKVASIIHQRRATEAARGVLDAIRAKAEAAQGAAARAEALRAAAAEKGLEVRTLRDMNDLSWRPNAPESPETDAEKARAESVRHLHRMMDDYHVLSSTAPGSFRTPIMHDDATGAAYLALVTATSDPAPEEMGDDALQSYRRQKQMMAMIGGLPVFSFEHVSKRCALEITDPTWKKLFETRRKAAEEETKGSAGKQ